mmetsp:Transcript_3989/g.11110  ORF Transcript_3989/g.11110 Transcript_3989/m.11110 type:complete len:111 (-) Transcript_3989:85-417(-)
MCKKNSVCQNSVNSNNDFRYPWHYRKDVAIWNDRRGNPRPCKICSHEAAIAPWVSLRYKNFKRPCFDNIAEDTFNGAGVAVGENDVIRLNVIVRFFDYIFVYNGQLFPKT